MFSQRDFLLLRKFTDWESSFEASTELGSSGAAPPAGEAIVMSAPAFTRTSYGWANSG